MIENVYDSKYFNERPANSLAGWPTGHCLSDWIDKGYIARDVGADYRIAD